MKTKTIKILRTKFFEKDMEELKDESIDKKTDKKIEMYNSNKESFWIKSKIVKGVDIRNKKIQLWQYRLDDDFRIVFIESDSEILLLHIFRKKSQKNFDSNKKKLLKRRIESIVNDGANVINNDVPKLVLFFSF